MFESEVQAAVEVLEADGLGEGISATTMPGRPSGTIILRIGTKHGQIEISMMFLPTGIQTTAFLNGNSILPAFQDANPLSLDGARAAAGKIVARINGSA